MRFWLREIIGWFLLVLGLIGFGTSYWLLLDQRPIDAAPLTFIAFIIFRGGMQLLKMGVAARICLQGQETPPANNATRKTLLERRPRPTPSANPRPGLKAS
ncbi:MAG: hypothetical protein AB7K24_09490 [Gemmataceae bacterium]